MLITGIVVITYITCNKSFVTLSLNRCSAIILLEFVFRVYAFESKNLVLYLLHGLKFLFTFDNKVYDLKDFDR